MEYSVSFFFNARGYMESAYIWLTLETLSKMQPASRIGESGLYLSFLKNVEKSPVSRCVSLRECVEIHSFFGVSSVWKVFGHFSDMAACISSMECIDSSMELMAVCVLIILSSAC